ncbi:hypothetical protein TNCV_3892591 [Trichonephila clavipes]|nr:hypothetical protein TNCV_3892591 [Trichonephila clavipes]
MNSNPSATEEPSVEGPMYVKSVWLKRALVGEEVWRVVPTQISFTSFDYGSKLRAPSPVGANQRLYLGRKEFSDWLDAQRPTLTALV